MDRISHPGSASGLDQSVVSPSVGLGSLHVLVPVKEEADALYGARYAGNLIDWGVPVKATILHVTAPDPGRRALLISRKEIKTFDEARAASLVRHAGRHFSQLGVPHGSYIVAGDVVFSILDTAELLGCHEIVLPRPVARFWPRLFTNNICTDIARASRSVPVLMVDENGLVSRNAN